MEQEITTSLGKGANFYQGIKHRLWNKTIAMKASYHLKGLSYTKRNKVKETTTERTK